MNFSVDDPLAGILSDGSDDSFFDDDILGKKKPARKKSTPTLEKKSALFDLNDSDKPKLGSSNVEKKESLFNIDAKKSPSPFKRNDSIKDSIKFSQVESKSKTDASKSPVKSKVLSTSADKIDIFGDLIESKREPKQIEKGKSSQSLLDDILGGPMKSTSATKPIAPARSQDFDIKSILGKGDVKTASSKSLPQKQTLKEKEKKEDSVKKTKSNEDWLEIFKDKPVDDEFEDDTGMPSWLVGDDSKKKKTEEKKTVLKEPENEKPREEPEEQVQIEEKKVADVKIDVEPSIESIMAPSKVLRSSNEDITAEGAALYLQQQEAQIMVALQLKAQEEKLAAMQLRQKETQRVQREATLAQHSQLDAMLRSQAENRQQMQNIIATHQERITQRIKALLGPENTDNEEIIFENHDNAAGEHHSTPHSREKKQLLQLVQSLQGNHDKEIDLMETSYRRQLAFLEVSLSQSEDRMKEESEKLIKFYTDKINWMEEHHNNNKKNTEENMAELIQRHKAENEMLRQQHLENVRVLQEHHATLMENMKNAITQEQVLIQDSAGFSSDLKELVSEVRESKHHCQELVEKVQALAENTERKTDNSIQVRESQIDDMIHQLKKERDNFEIEKAENRESIKMLETRMKQMTVMIEEESASLKQKRMEFEFEKATFQKQTEYAKNILKKQDEEIKILQEEIQKEYQDKKLKIEEEKAKVVKECASLVREKSAIQNMKQELEKMKAELQAQLEEVAADRSKINVQKEQVHLEEQRIVAKSRDLDILAKAAIEKQSQADKKYSEAEFLQRKYEERIRRIQEHVVSLNSREKQIAREKVTLSRERLTLHNERKEIEGRQQCSLCRSTQNTQQIYDPNYTLLDSFLHGPSVTREFRDSTVTSTMNTIGQEMTHLVGKNLNLRHSAAIGDLAHYQSREIEERLRQADTSPIQLESESSKGYMDPKFMMLRLDVQKVLGNLEKSKKEESIFLEDEENEEK